DTDQFTRRAGCDGFQGDSVVNGEDDGVEADSEGEREDGDSSEAWGAGQSANGEAKIHVGCQGNLATAEMHNFRDTVRAAVSGDGIWCPFGGNVARRNQAVAARSFKSSAHRCSMESLRGGASVCTRA